MTVSMNLEGGKILKTRLAEIATKVANPANASGGFFRECPI